MEKEKCHNKLLVLRAFCDVVIISICFVGIISMLLFNWGIVDRLFVIRFGTLAIFALFCIMLAGVFLIEKYMR